MVKIIKHRAEDDPVSLAKAARRITVTVPSELADGGAEQSLLEWLANDTKRLEAIVESRRHLDPAAPAAVEARFKKRMETLRRLPLVMEKIAQQSPLEPADIDALAQAPEALGRKCATQSIMDNHYRQDEKDSPSFLPQLKQLSEILGRLNALLGVTTNPPGPAAGR